MWHVAIFAQPICWSRYITHCVTNNTRWFDHACLWVNSLVKVQFLTILVVWSLFVVTEEIDTRSQEVDG